MFDYEKMIIEIESRPCLWDIGSKEYSDKNLRALSWNLVAEAMYADWNELSPSQKDERAKDLKEKRWRNVRDYYIKWNKEENSTPSGSGASKKKKYHYADILSFLKPVAEKRNTSGNFEDNLDESVQGKQTFEEINPSGETEQNAIASTSTSQVHSKKFKKSAKETVITPFQNKLLTYLEERECNDPDKHFLLSLLPDYKNLNDSQKLDFRINALNFFKNAQQSYNISSSSSTYQPANVYQNDNSYQGSSSFCLPPHRQPEINNPYYPNISHNVLPPYPQPVVYSPSPQPRFSQYQQEVTSNASNATFSLTNISSNFPPDTPTNK